MALGRKRASSGTYPSAFLKISARDSPQAELQVKPWLQVGWRKRGWSDTSSLGHLSPSKKVGSRLQAMWVILVAHSLKACWLFWAILDVALWWGFRVSDPLPETRQHVSQGWHGDGDMHMKAKDYAVNWSTRRVRSASGHVRGAYPAMWWHVWTQPGLNNKDWAYI